jgi:hypothetical protein
MTKLPNEKITKEEAVSKILEMTVTHDAPRIPGALIKKCSEKLREVLKTLTSEDFNRRIK